MSGSTDQATLERILTRALRAPTADNRQPFRLERRGATLLVAHPGHGEVLELLAARLALGCFLEVLSLAAGAEGRSVQAEVAPEGLAAELRFTRGERDPLEAFLERRETDRRRFRGGAPGEVAGLLADETVTVVPLDRELARLVARSEGFTLRHPPTCRSVSRTLRFGDELQRQRTGVPFESFGLPLPATRLVRSVLVGGAEALALAPLDRLLAPWIRGRLVGAAGLVFAAAEDERGLVRAGRAMLRAWLRLNAAGFGVQPMSFCSLTLFAASASRLPPDAPEPWPTLWRDAAGRLAPRVGGTPCWAFRVGRSTELPAHLRTPRLDLDEVYVTDQTSRSPTRSSAGPRSMR